MYKYCLFDLDGTLTQSEFGIIKAVEYALGKFDIKEPDREKLLHFIGPPVYVSFREFYGMNDKDAELGVKLFREKYESETLTEAPLYDGITQVLKKLKDNDIKLMVVTAKPTDMAEKVLSHVGIKDYFDCIIGAAREKKDSSKASLIEKAIEASGQTDISQFIMIGDTHYDIDAAVTVGIDSIGATYGYGTYEEIKDAGATYIADTPSDILKYTCGLSSWHQVK